MKNIFYKLPKKIRRAVVWVIEFGALLYIKTKSKQGKSVKHPKNETIHVLIYHVSALSFGGTEKNLQMIAKYLDKSKYTVFLMHGTKSEKNRTEYLKDSQVRMIHFTYDSIQPSWPYVIENMSVRIDDVIKEHTIDCIITATPGQTIFPLIQIRNIPIILINIFGSFSVQKNISKHICISEEVKTLANRVVPEDALWVEYIPSERPIKNKARAAAIRSRFNIKDSDLVFGRIGRADDSIFDPIGLLAFEIAVKTNTSLHYVIMSPANAAKKLVLEHKIPNVHWVEPSYNEEDVWAFHEAIDVLAHFRMDGESFGLNIAESMLVGNPILTHKSHIWNAHLEYLDETFSLCAEKDDYIQYSKNMLTFASLHSLGKLKQMGQLAQCKAESLFLIENSIERYEKIIQESQQ